MNKVNSINLSTDRLDLRIPTMQKKDLLSTNGKFIIKKNEEAKLNRLLTN